MHTCVSPLLHCENRVPQTNLCMVKAGLPLNSHEQGSGLPFPSCICTSDSPLDMSQKYKAPWRTVRLNLPCTCCCCCWLPRWFGMRIGALISLGFRLLYFLSSIAADFLPTFMYCLGSRDFEVVQTALRNLPEYTLLCQGKEETCVFPGKAWPCLAGLFKGVQRSNR